ncbi:hypothetical protein PULV_a6005 [Pseudoalteromonas ulvae UL12]|nr:hypothetical protein [Pseudoalteromonas ulvae UL12]
MPFYNVSRSDLPDFRAIESLASLNMRSYFSDLNVM